jgi:serine/threonine protein kinase/tetratricopeptide (TPR) repeat protein
VTLATGTRLGPYEILAPIGAGGMGEVYRARDSRLNRDVAIKVPPEHLAQNPAALARFEREARAVAALSHPNILDIHDFGTDRGVSFVVTELLKGETLRRRLAAGPMPWREAARIALALANGLTAAHSSGVVHRDLKPENIFLTEDDRVKILDFGLARLEADPSSGGSRTVPTATETGTILGTVGYMSPEQVRSEKADARSDIFSLGCVLYEMVTGIHAFKASSVPETLVAILREEPADPASLVPDLPEALSLTLHHCLAKSPKDRFQSARDVALALEDATGVAASGLARLPARRRSLRPALVAGIFVAVTLAVVAGIRFALVSRAAIDSLAVLPFANATGDPDAEYLGDGLSESLTNSLSRFPNLTVLAHSSVLAFKKETDALKVGRALGARAVLTGAVSRRGDNLVIRAELIDVRRGANLWGDRYDRKASDLQQVEQEIDAELSRRLGVRLPGQEQRPPKRSTTNADAYDLYLQGRSHWNKRSPEEIARSIEFFERAIKLDPGYGLAYVGLADAYDLLAFYGALPPKEAVPKWRDAAIRALEIDESLGEAHASLADARYQFEWDWAGAEQGFRRSIALNPGSATARQWYSNYLSVLGRFDESVEQIRLARQLDPLNVVIRNDEGLAQIFAGNEEKGMALLRRAIELDPNHPLPRIYLSLVAASRGETEVAISQAKAAMKLNDGDPDSIALYGYACARAGRREEALGAIKQLEDLARDRYVDAFIVAFPYVGLKEKQKALDALEKAYEQHSLRLVFLKVMRALDPLRGEPRFQSLVARMKFPGP